MSIRFNFIFRAGVFLLDFRRFGGLLPRLLGRRRRLQGLAGVLAAVLSAAEGLFAKLEVEPTLTTALLGTKELTKKTMVEIFLFPRV